MNIRILKRALEIAKTNTPSQIEDMIKLLHSNDITPIIVEAIEGEYKVDIVELKGKSRKRSLVDARHAAMYLMYKHASMTLKQIGNYFGGRDHATVIHAIDSVTNNMFFEDYKVRVDRVENIVEIAKDGVICDVTEEE